MASKRIDRLEAWHCASYGDDTHIVVRRTHDHVYTKPTYWSLLRIGRLMDNPPTGYIIVSEIGGGGISVGLRATS